jgi:hypothetical protein
MGTNERKGQKDGRAAAEAFYGGSVARAEKKGGKGGPGSAPRGGREQEERGGLRCGGDSLGGWHRPPAGGAMARHGRATGRGATLARAADRWDRATAASLGGRRWGAEGRGGSEAAASSGR